MSFDSTSSTNSDYNRWNSYYINISDDPITPLKVKPIKKEPLKKEEIHIFDIKDLDLKEVT